MAYTPQTWVNGSAGGTPLSATRLQHADDGITETSNRLDVLTTVTTVAASGAALTLDASTSSAKKITLTGNCALTLTGATAGQVASLELLLIQDATGSRTITWPTSVKWAGGAPTLSTTAGAVDRIVLVSYNGGTTWYADLIGKAYA